MFLVSCTLFLLTTAGSWLVNISVLWRPAASNDCLESWNESTYESTLLVWCSLYFWLTLNARRNVSQRNLEITWVEENFACFIFFFLARKSSCDLSLFILEFCASPQYRISLMLKKLFCRKEPLEKIAKMQLKWSCSYNVFVLCLCSCFQELIWVCNSIIDIEGLNTWLMS